MWHEQQRQQILSAGVASISFDNYEDLVFLGGTNGQITSYIYPGGKMPIVRYTSFPGHTQPVTKIISLEHGILSAGFDNVRFTNKRGVMQWNKILKNTSTIAMLNNMELVVASSSGTLTLMNWSRGTTLKQVDVDQGILALRTGKYLFSASSSGQVTFRDPVTFRQEHAMQFHTGGVSSFDVYGNYMVSTGYSIRGANLITDPLIKVFDLRVNKFLPPIPCTINPTIINFHPNYASSILVASQSGALQLCDINDANQSRSQFYQAEVNGYMTTMEFSSSGELFALGDAFGIFQLWCQRDMAKVNSISKPSEYKDDHPQLEYPEFDDGTPLNTVGMPYYTKPLLSVWPSNLLFPIGRPSPKIPPEVLKNVKMVDFVGYAPNPKTFKRNQVPVSEEKTMVAPKFRSEQELEQIKGEVRSVDKYESSKISIDTGIPHHYKSVEIKYSRFGVEDFDFGFYNKTEYGGLETDIRNSYCNSILQMLFFIWPLREITKAHIRSSCFKEPCLTCELGFLFRMLEGSKGVNCQASNFLRAFGLVQQANNLGLLEPEHITSDSDISYGALIQTFCRFILEQICIECSSGNGAPSLIDDKFVQRLFSIPVLSTSQCNEHHRQEREISPFVIDLIYPRKGNGSHPSFVEVLAKSINRESVTKAWCSQCNQYQMTVQSKELLRMPNFMCINSNILTDTDLNFWIEETEIKLKKGPGHLISHINVSDAEGKPEWVFFNDFCVLPVANEERTFKKWKIPSIVQFAKRSPETTSSFFLSPVNPDFRILSDNHLLNRRVDLVMSYTPLTFDEIPQGPGYLCAIDAEFVVMATAESEIRSDGTNTLIRPSRYSLARVSVVRGEGPNEGVPFIDDYIYTSEPVCDYLTEYSGIREGDLDPLLSRKPLVSLKIAYKRLRLLVDMGCIFVGHDLRKDCRTINILIPPSQIIDTNRQRKLSLRFLAWCLLKEDIQTTTHDSVEDARTALLLYKKYCEIQKAGNFEKVMEDIYREGSTCNFRPPNAKHDPRQRMPSSEIF
ncbi:poly(A)-specific ribonuclease [Boothiomyces sp. JEL0838]|nr:poly(A)-specific ribonuclease [Boothiomyces sp. JEL0838]